MDTARAADRKLAIATNPGQKATGARVLADMLAGYGVSHVFMVPAVLRRTMAELERRTAIHRIQTHGEKAAAYMADGYARACGRPGICMAQHVGALNLAAGLRDAYLAHSPVLAFTGGRDSRTKFRKLYQEVDDVPAFEQVTKFNATVDAAERIPDLVRQAFRPEPELGSVRQALALLEQAERPVLVAGGGVRASGAAAELVALAEKLAVPVATSLNGKDVIRGDHPLAAGVVGTYSRESANLLVAQADLVCFIGTATGGMTTNIWNCPKVGVAAIQIDIDPEALGRNYPLRAAVLGDAKAALARMLQHADNATAKRRAAWIETARTLCREWREKTRPMLESNAVPIRPERLCNELAQHMPQNAIVLADTGHAGMWMGGMFDLKSESQSYMRSGGHLGWAFPAGLGAKCAAPERPVVVFTGDSGFWYHIAEIETAVRWNIN